LEFKECKYCLSEIPIKASKCKFCLEWQAEIESKITVDKVNVSKKILTVNEVELKRPFQFLLVKKLPFPYYVSVFIIGAIFFALIQFSWYKLDEDKIYLLSFLAFTIQLIITWSCLIWIYNVINENHDFFIKISSLETKEALSKFYLFNKKMFNNKLAVSFGIIAGLVAVIGDYVVGTPFKSMEAKYIFAGYEFVYMLFAGAAIYSMLNFAFFLHQITSNPTRKLMLLDQKRSINKIGAIHLKTSVLAIFPFVLGVVAKLIGSWAWELPIIIWYATFAIAIIVYIYWPMINVHNFMSFDIENQIAIVQEKIRSKLLDLERDPSSSNFRKLNELRDLEASISSQNTWPFDTKSLSAIFAAIIAPILLMIFDKFWSI